MICLEKNNLKNINNQSMLKEKLFKWNNNKNNLLVDNNHYFNNFNKLKKSTNKP